MRRQGNHPTRPTRQFVALIAVLLLAAAFASFLFLNSTTSTTSIAQSIDTTEYKAVGAVIKQICAIKKSDGSIWCWGDTDFQGGAMPTDSGYASLHMGNRWNCALKTDGTAKCFGNIANNGPNNVGRNNDTGKYHDIHLGEWYHACWIKRDDTANSAEDGKVQCEAYSSWADQYTMVVVPPAVENYSFQSVVASLWDTCGLVVDSDRSTAGNQDEGAVKCWGYNQIVPPPNTTFKSLDLGDLHMCGVVKDDDTSNNTPNDDEDSVKCWGDRFDGKLDPPAGMAFKSVGAGEHHTCGIVIDSDTSNQTADEDTDTVRCWGNSIDGKIGAPEGTFKELAVGGRLSCAIAIDADPSQTGTQSPGTVACWGDLSDINRDNNDYQCLYDVPSNYRCYKTPVPTPILPEATPTVTPVRDKVEAVSAGQYTTCILTGGGNVRCTGRSAGGEGEPPANVRVDTISVGRAHACGLSRYGEYGKRPEDIPADVHWRPADTNVVCWGDNHYGQSNPSEGAFKVVAAGSASSCGIKTDGSIKCWGVDRPPNWGLIDSAPTGTNFVDIKIGYDAWKEHACARVDNGSITCWGPNNTAAVKTPVPENHSFQSLSNSLGKSSICAIVEDSDTSNQTADEDKDEVKCWGNGHTSSDPEINSIKDFPTDITFKEIATTGNATCAILKQDYQKLRNKDTEGTSVYDRKTGTPYCRGVPDNFSSGQIKVSGSNKYYEYFQEASKTYHGISAGTAHTCAVRSDGLAECAGAFGGFGQDVAPAVVGIPPATVQDSYTWSGLTYSGASAFKDGRFSATDKSYYVDIPAGAIKNATVIGVRMTQGANDVEFSNVDGYQFVRKVHSVAGKIAPSGTTDVTSAVLDTRRIDGVDTRRIYDVCLPKPSNLAGRWRDWRLYKVENNQPVPSTWWQGFTVIDGAVCGEVDEIPVSAVLAHKAIPNDLVREAKVGTTALADDVYVRIDGEALPSGGSRLVVRKVDPSRPLDSLGNLYRVGDLYVEINLLNLNDEDIGATLNPPAEICIAAPYGFDKEIYHLGDNATKWNKLPPLDTSLLTGVYVKYGTGDYACGVSDTLSTFVATALKGAPTPTPTPIAVPVIFRIAPTINSVTLLTGEKVRLGVDVYGMQNIRDNRLADKHKITFEWSSSPPAGSFAEANREADADSKVDDREVIYTVPQEPGTYTLKAFVDRMVCGDDDGLDDGCFAEIQITVRRPFAVVSPTTTPSNPDGEIPSIITDSDGNLYKVFTPEEGGNFDGNDATVSADPGAVPNGEIIGLRTDADGTASNVGQVLDRVTLDGNYYTVSAVDAAGQPLSGYLLDDPIEVCIPVPPRLKSNISDVAMVSVRDDGTFAVLSSRLRLGDAGVTMCAALSTLSARVAAAHTGSPSALPSPTPLPTPIDPDTGGTTMPTSAIILLMMLGAALGLMSVMLMARRR